MSTSEDSETVVGSRELAETITETRAAAQEGETLLTYIRHYWCGLTGFEVREEPLVTDDGRKIGTRRICERCGQPTSYSRVIDFEPADSNGGDEA